MKGGVECMVEKVNKGTDSLAQTLREIGIEPKGPGETLWSGSPDQQIQPCASRLIGEGASTELVTRLIRLSVKHGRSSSNEQE